MFEVMMRMKCYWYTNGQPDNKIKTHGWTEMNVKLRRNEQRRHKHTVVEQ